MKTKKKVITIVGARPQFIKAAPVSRALQNVGIEEILLHTGQHYDNNMAAIFFNEMNIPTPQYNLNIHNLSHGAMTGRMMEKIEEILKDEKPDTLIVFGDTNSTLAGALTAKKLGIPVAHIEAGLRSYNMRMPEEINRVATDRISDILFCPTTSAVNNLKKEGYEQLPCSIVLSGDVMQDAANFFTPFAKAHSAILSTLKIEDKSFVLATLHRQENVDNIEHLSSIISALNIIHKEIPVIIPMHPRTAKKIEEFNLKTNFITIEPVGYLDMITLLQSCNFVMTDSGGLQKEAYFFKKSCITLREETEWTELVEHNINTIVGAKKEAILSAYQNMDSNPKDFSLNLYGEGHAAEIIANHLL